MSSPGPQTRLPPPPQAPRGYPDSALQPAAHIPHTHPQPANAPPPGDQHGPPSSSAVASMSSSPRGRRAPAPAALDLGPRTDGSRYGAVGLGLGAGHEADGRRVFTEPVSFPAVAIADVAVAAHVQAAAASARPRSVFQRSALAARRQPQLVSSCHTAQR